MKKNWIVFAPLALVGIAAFVAAGGWIVQVLWNWLLPALLGVPEIGFWQAIGVLALCRILFGGFGSGGSGGSRIRRRIDRRIDERIEERIAGLSPEERERFRERLRAKFGCAPPSGPGDPP